MHFFNSAAEVETVLAELAGGEDPLTVHLERQPGQKEARWTHLVGGEPEEPVAPFEPAGRGSRAPGLAERVSELEDRIARLEEALGIEPLGSAPAHLDS